MWKDYNRAGKDVVNVNGAVAMLINLAVFLTCIQVSLSEPQPVKMFDLDRVCSLIESLGRSEALPVGGLEMDSYDDKWVSLWALEAKDGKLKKTAIGTARFTEVGWRADLDRRQFEACDEPANAARLAVSALRRVGRIEQKVRVYVFPLKPSLLEKRVRQGRSTWEEGAVVQIDGLSTRTDCWTVSVSDGGLIGSCVKSCLGAGG